MYVSQHRNRVGRFSPLFQHVHVKSLKIPVSPQICHLRSRLYRYELQERRIFFSCVYYNQCYNTVYCLSYRKATYSRLNLTRSLARVVPMNLAPIKFCSHQCLLLKTMHCSIQSFSTSVRIYTRDWITPLYLKYRCGGANLDPVKTINHLDHMITTEKFQGLGEMAGLRVLFRVYVNTMNKHPWKTTIISTGKP